MWRRMRALAALHVRPCGTAPPHVLRHCAALYLTPSPQPETCIPPISITPVTTPAASAQRLLQRAQCERASRVLVRARRQEQPRQPARAQATPGRCF